MASGVKTISQHSLYILLCVFVEVVPVAVESKFDWALMEEVVVTPAKKDAIEEVGHPSLSDNE